MRKKAGASEASEQSLVYNLTTLEINTIIKDNLTARKLPDPANAILDVGFTYAWKLADLGFNLRHWFVLAEGMVERRPQGVPVEPPSAALKRLDALNTALEAAARDIDRSGLVRRDATEANVREEDITLDAGTFIILRWAAWLAGEVLGAGGSDRIVLDRIRKNSDQMKSIVLRLYGTPAFEAVRGATRSALNRIGEDAGARRGEILQLEPKDMTTLRKVWEIGVQEVVAQTVIDLDGDTITYISRRYTAPSWAHILEVHRLGVQSAVGYWNNLMQALQKFLTDLVRLIAGGGG